MRKIIFWIVSITVVGIIGYAVSTKIRNQPESGTRSRAKAGSGIAVPVEITNVAIRNIRNVHTFTGTLEPWSKYEVAPKIAGRLETLTVEAGDPVYNGQLLATIDDDEYLQEIEKAKADLNISEAVKGELITQFNLAKSEYDRSAKMRKTNVISESEYDSKRSDYLLKSASLKKAQAELNQKQAILNLARVRFDYTKIYAGWNSKKNLIFDIIDPNRSHSAKDLKKITDKLLINNASARRYGLKNAVVEEKSPGHFTLEFSLTGQLYNFAPLEAEIMKMLSAIRQQLSPAITIKIQEDSPVRYIGRKYVDAGQMLKANDAILSIINIRRMKAMVNVIEKDYPLLESGQAAAVTTDAYPGRVFAGKVRKITKILDEYTRQAQVEIEVDNPQLRLRPGMFVKVSIEFAVRKNVQVVPKNTVVNFNDITGVFMVSADRKSVQFIPATTGLTDGNDLEIVSPRLPRPLVTLGNHLLYNGVAINITSREKVLKDIEKKTADSVKNRGKETKRKTGRAQS